MTEDPPVAFLRGEGVELRPVDAPARTRLRSAPWLRPLTDSHVVALALARPGEAPAGLVALQQVDWVARRARVAAWWRDGLPPDWAAAPVALRLLVAYARDELNLDRLDAQAEGAEGSRALDEGGLPGGAWRRDGAGSA